jgi:hypothetical protein
MLRRKGLAGGKRRRWAERLAARRGKWVAVARRLAGMLCALWCEGSVDAEVRVGQRPHGVAVAVSRQRRRQVHAPRFAARL